MQTDEGWEFLKALIGKGFVDIPVIILKFSNVRKLMISDSQNLKKI